MQLWHIGRQIGIALVGADDEGSGLGDRKIAAGHPRVGFEDQRAGRLPLRFRQVVDVTVARVGPDRAGKYLGHIGAQLVHGGHDDMARILIVELLDALPKIGLDYLYADRGHVGPKATLLGEHRLALDERRSTVVAQDGVDDLVVLGTVARPMHVDPVRSRIGLELVEILVEMGKRVLLDRRSKRPKLLPFGNAVHLTVALLPQVPEPLVMHLLVLGSGNEAGGGLCLVDRPVATDHSPTRLRLGRLRPQRRSTCPRRDRGGGRHG